MGVVLSGFPQEARLLSLLEEATELAERVADLAKEQSRLLASDDLNGFNIALDHGQTLIDKINGLHQESEALMQSYASYAVSENGGKIEAIETAVARFAELLDQGATMNARNLGEAKEKAQEFIRQIGNLSMKRKSLGLYAQHGGGSSEIFDKKT